MKIDNPKFTTLPDEVRKFCLAAVDNAKKVEEWDDDPNWLNDLLYIETHDDGRIVICDNFDGKFFSTVYTYHKDGRWTTRKMWHRSFGECETVDRDYSFLQAMSDANMMYTG